MMEKIKIIMLLCLAVLLASCVKEDLIEGGTVAEGKAATISVSLKGAQMGSETKSRALTPEDEKKIKNIHVLIFNNKDELVTNMHFDSYVGGIEVPTYSGKGRTIYVVANGDAHTNIDKDLIRVKKRADLDAIVVENSVRDLQRTNGLIMAGDARVDITPGKSTFNTPIQLSYLSAKLILNVYDKTPADQSVQILGWDVVDASAKGYLNQKDVDAVDVNKDADFFTTNGKYKFEVTNVDGKSATQEIYLFENRRGGRVDKALPDDESKIYNGMNVNDENDKGKAWYAPDRATCIRIHAMHNSNSGSTTKQILAKIYIGGNNHSNYDIIRGTLYTFNVTVMGLDSIKIDSNVDYQEGNLHVDHGTDLLMDTHYDFRPIRLQAAKGVATIEILDNQMKHYDDLGFDATWLKVSPINLMNVQIYQDANSRWQEIAGENRFSRPKYIPHRSVRAELTDKGGWNTVPADYPNDDKLPLKHATYRMCYKITDIEFPNPAVATPQIFQVYADENIKSTNQRTAYVQVTYTKEGFEAKEVETLLITQEGRLSIFPNSEEVGLYQLDASGVPVGSKQRFAIERREEPALILNPGIGLNFQQTEVMQWGFPGENLYDEANKYRNGQFLTANAVFQDNVVSLDANGLPMWEIRSSDYRSVYGNEGAAIPDYVGTGQQPPYYLPVPDKDKVYHPIYNSSAARYCFEKNRDRNGDGKIDQSEAVWYLPSRDEMLMILVANSEEIDNTFPSIGYGMFWTSTQRTPYPEIVKGKPTGQNVFDTYAVGPAFGFAPSTGGDSPLRVRCIRNIPLP